MLTIDDNNLTTHDGLTIPWREIVAVHAERIDAKSHSITMITFDHVSGEFVEISTDEDGFDTIRLGLSDCLPIPKDWMQTVDDLPLCGTITLMQREL